jgi:hypothetical protein
MRWSETSPLNERRRFIRDYLSGLYAHRDANTFPQKPNEETPLGASLARCDESRGSLDVGPKQLVDGLP